MITSQYDFYKFIGQLVGADEQLEECRQQERRKRGQSEIEEAVSFLEFMAPGRLV